MLVNVSKQGSEKTLGIGMCRELGVAFKQAEQEASFEKHPQSWQRSSLRARGVKKKTQCVTRGSIIVNEKEKGWLNIIG